MTIEIPDIATLPDEQLETLAEMRDGRWSEQTRGLLARFETTRLDLNSAWSETWTGWTCPCCRRTKPQIARLSPGGVLLCRLEYHHDHIADLMKRIYRECNPPTDDMDLNAQISRARDLIKPLIERFELTLICLDCNSAEGKAKAKIGADIDSSFSFSPPEIAQFISIGDNRTHEVDIESARKLWVEAKKDFAERVQFSRYMAKRVASGHHRRHRSGDQGAAPILDRDIVYRLFRAAAPSNYRSQLCDAIEARSVSNDSAGQSPGAKPKRNGKAPTDAEFAAIEAQKTDEKTWHLAAPDWRCPCCARTKRETCRKSNKRAWTASVQRFGEYILEDREESLVWRRRDSVSDIIVGSYKLRLLCHDCRNVVAELKRRRAGLTDNSLTFDNLRELVGAAVPHIFHDIDFDRAVSLAAANAALLQAIDEFLDHKSRAIRAYGTMKECNWSRRKAVEIFGVEYAKANNVDLEDGGAHAEWLLSEGRRFATQRDDFS